MKAFILGIMVEGIKNIDKPCHLSFYKQIFKGKIDFKDYNVKAIYGMNGAGKTGIIYALDIYRAIASSNNLSDRVFNKRVSESINKTTKKFIIEVEFVIKDGEKISLAQKYKHRMELKQRKDELIISREVLEFSKMNSSKRVIVYESVDGGIKDSILSDLLLSKMINIAHKRSIIEIVQSELIDLGSEYKNSEMNTDFKKVAAYALLLSNLFVFIDAGDRYIEPKFDSDNFVEDVLDLHVSSFSSPIQISGITFDNTDFITKEHINKYKDYISGLEGFIKLFRDDLVSIEIETKENAESYIVEKYFNYGKYRVSYIFESTGIKKLVKIYSAFKALTNGSIVFYDELDANINDIYLMKLVEYVSEYTNGQLIFTTHNVGPMEVLKNKKKSIDFLTHTSEIVEWKKNGNYSVSNLYRSGMIEKHPFNLEAYDFIGIFEDANKEAR